MAFLQELRDVRVACPGAWLLCGDFNMIYRAEDKNNRRLNRRSMRRFARLLNDLLLSELFLHGRLFPWSSEHEHPTLEWIDRVFVTSEWLQLYPTIDCVLSPRTTQTTHCYYCTPIPSLGPGGGSNLRPFGFSSMASFRSFRTPGTVWFLGLTIVAS